MTVNFHHWPCLIIGRTLEFFALISCSAQAQAMGRMYLLIHSFIYGTNVYKDKVFTNSRFPLRRVDFIKVKRFNRNELVLHNTRIGLDMAKNMYKLTYWDCGGFAEPIRWIFKYADVPFEDERIEWDYPKWFQNLKSSYNSSVGQIPVLLINGKEQLCQSAAISTYLAEEFGLVGKTSLERARGNEVISLLYDLIDVWRKNTFEMDATRKENKKAEIDEKFRLYYGKFEQILKDSNGDFINGNTVTHADFWMTSWIQFFNNPVSGSAPVMPLGMPELQDSDLYINLLDEYPALKRHNDCVLQIPQIKNWIRERHNTTI